jgi:hypothetical protein
MSIIFFTSIVICQVPNKMSYQAVVRNISNQLVVSQQIGVRFSILQGSITGSVIYSEIYNPNPTTNANGLVTLEIGGGLPVTGTFSAIDWTNGPFFIKTEIDPTGSTDYSITGTSQILSVPYALFAKTAGNGFTGDYSDLTNKPDFFNWDDNKSDDFSGNYNDLINKPILFNGNYTDLTNKPIIPLINDASILVSFNP